MSRFGYSLVVAIGLRGALSSSGEGTAGKLSGPVIMDRLSQGSQIGSQRFDPNEIVEQVGANDQHVGKGSACCFRPVSYVFQTVFQTCRSIWQTRFPNLRQVSGMFRVRPTQLSG